MYIYSYFLVLMCSNESRGSESVVFRWVAMCRECISFFKSGNNPERLIINTFFFVYDLLFRIISVEYLRSRFLTECASLYIVRTREHYYYRTIPTSYRLSIYNRRTPNTVPNQINDSNKLFVHKNTGPSEYFPTFYASRLG